MRRGLLVADVQGWAFDQNNSDAIEYCGGHFDLKNFYMSDYCMLPLTWDVDFVFCPWHMALNKFRNRTLLGSLRSQWFDTSNPQPPRPHDINAVNQCAGFHVVTRGVYEALKPHCPGVVYLTNPVNTRRFPRATTVDKEIICCWNGNAQHSSAGHGVDVKGFYTIILPACSNVGAKLVMAEYHTNKLRPHQMPRFYQRANVALCASAFEGASNSVMEAMASGLAVIATDVGNHREMHESMLRHLGDSGMLLVGRGVNSFAEAISSLTPKRALEMGAINRQEIQERWSWDVWRERYLDFYSMAVRK